MCHEHAGKAVADEMKDSLAPISEGVLPVIIPMFNERACELVNTLISIREAAQRSGPVRLFVIQDGWDNLDRTARQLFQAMFPPDQFGDFANIMESTESERTCIIERTGFDLGNLRGLPELELDELKSQLAGAAIDITLVLKRRNHKKHNSHDVFFNLAYQLNAEFAFATDCGTMFAPDHLKLLLKKIRKDNNCIAVTGRQRVMTKAQQPGCHNEGPVETALRLVQGFEYDASTVLYNGCFSLFGCLPVIPGPCGLFRVRPLFEDDGEGCAFDTYMAACTEVGGRYGMLRGNCALAEDRPFTFAATYCTNGKYSAQWVQHAVFYFQAETDLATLVAQRRRWLNGTAAGYYYVFKELGSKRLRSKHGCLRVLVNRVLIALMFLIYLGIALAPMLYIYGMCVSLRYLMFSDFLSFVAAPAVYSLAYLLFAVRHHYVKFDRPLFYVCGFLNACAAGIMSIAIAYDLRDGGRWISWAALSCLVLPVLLNLAIPDVRTACWLLFPPVVVLYVLFMPTMIGYFFTVAMARTHDLSWGNRDVGAEETSLRHTSLAIMSLQIALNIFMLLATLSLHVRDINSSLMNEVLFIFLMSPTVLISLVSMLQLLGFGWIALGSIVASTMLMVQHSKGMPLDLCFAEMHKATLCFEGTHETSLVAGALLLVLLLKILFVAFRGLWRKVAHKKGPGWVGEVVCIDDGIAATEIGACAV